MQIVVLADGLATRPSPESEQVPSSLLLVRGRPLIDWQLDRFSASGARSIVLCVGFLGEQIETHVKRALDRGLKVSYSYAGAEQVGGERSRPPPPDQCDHHNCHGTSRSCDRGVRDGPSPVACERAGDGGEADVAEPEPTRLHQVHDEEGATDDGYAAEQVDHRLPRPVAGRRDSGSDSARPARDRPGRARARIRPADTTGCDRRRSA